MITLKPTEKVLFLLTLIAALLGGNMVLTKQRRVALQKIERDRDGILEHIEKLKSDKLKASAKSLPVMDSKLTLTLLDDLMKGVGAAHDTNIVRIDRNSETSFKIVLEGKFLEIVKLIVHLDRKESRFDVKGAEFEMEQSDVLKSTLHVAIKSAA